MTKLNSSTVVKPVFADDAIKPLCGAGRQGDHCCARDDVIAVDVHIRCNRNAIADVGCWYMPTLPLCDDLIGQILDYYA